MSRCLSAFVGLGCLAFVLGAGAAESPDLERVTPVSATEVIPIADFFRPTLFTSPKINPTGTHIAALISSGEDKYELLAYDLKSQHIERLGGSRELEIYDFHWLGAERILYSLAHNKIYGIGVHCVELGRFRKPYPVLQFAGARLVGIPRADRTHPLFWASELEGGNDDGVVRVTTNVKNGMMVNLLSAGRAAEYFYDIRDQNRRMMTRRFPVPRGGSQAGYMVDKEGELAFAYTHKDGYFTLHRWTGDNWETCPIDLDRFEIIDVGNAPGEIVVLDERQPGKPRSLRMMDAATGRLGVALLEDVDYDFNGWLYRDPVSRNVVGAVYDRKGPSVIWFDEGYRALQSALDALFPKQIVRLLGSDDKGKTFLVRTSSDRDPGAYQWVNLENRQAGLIKRSRPWIDPERMRPMSTFTYKTRDGLKFDAYLTLPAGASKENPPPLIVLPHGGPWVRDSWGYSSETQFLASRGYAVLQPNYRGSTGYSWMYPEEEEWAFQKMHEDVTDCVKLIARSGHVDSKRIAIMGGSFGGYLTLMGLTSEPELYRCGVTMAGVFDWAAMIRGSRYERFDNPRYARLVRKLGDPRQEATKFEAMSPIHRVDAIKVPVLVAHGKEDRVVESSESKRLVAALERHGVPHESLFFGEEGHGLGNLKNEIKLYSRIETFLEQHLKAAK